MTQAIVNLALPVIKNKVEEILHSSPDSSYQTVFASTALKEKLVAYVLRRMPTLYTTADASEACAVHQPANCFSREQQTQMDSLIHLGIQHLATQQTTWDKTVQSSSSGGNPAPSHWFG